MIINGSTLDAIFLNLKANFNNAFEAAPSNWEKVAMKVPSTGRYTDYRWLNRFPKMERWVGEKTIKRLVQHGYQIINEDWQATVEVDRNDIEDDQLGIYQPQAQGAGFSAKQLPDELIFDIISNGFGPKALCYDGQPFFSAGHPVGETKKTSVSNTMTKALSCAGLAAAQASYGAARIQMMKFKDDAGRPLNCIPNILLVPPALADIANTLMTNDRLQDGMPNPYKGTATVVIEPRLTSDTAWFLLDTTKPVKPFIYQERKAPVFVQQINMDSPTVFMQKTYLFGAEARAAAGYGFWQMAIGSTGAG